MIRALGFRLHWQVSVKNKPFIILGLTGLESDKHIIMQKEKKNVQIELTMNFLDVDMAFKKCFSLFFRMFSVAVICVRNWSVSSSNTYFYI